MIRIRLRDPDISSTRIAPSPLWETVGSLLLLGMGDVPWPYEEWARSARRCLPALDVSALAPVLGSQPCVPDSFIPTPDAEVSIEDELEHIVSASPAAIRREIEAEFPDGVPSELAAFVDDPGWAAERFASAVYEFWSEALASDWPAMQALLERDLLRRARQVARQGSEAVFADLHERIHWQRPTLEIRKHYEFDLSSDGRGIVLVPMVFSRAALLISLSKERGFAVSYPARGVASLWGASADVEDERLEVLLGSGRAAVLRRLVEPHTTLELAEGLRLAASTVSHHLSVLGDADLLVRRRIGRRVYYELNKTGQSLASLFGVAADAASSQEGFGVDRMR